MLATLESWRQAASNLLGRDDGWSSGRHLRRPGVGVKRPLGGGGGVPNITSWAIFRELRFDGIIKEFLTASFCSGCDPGTNQEMI